MSPVDIISFISTGLIATVFIFSAVLKLLDVSSVVSSMHQLRVPRFLRNRVSALLLIALEISAAVGVFFASGWLKFVSLSSLTILLILFTALLMRSLRFQEPIFCNCFGSSLERRSVSVRTVIRNLFFLVTALLALVTFNDKYSSFQEFNQYSMNQKLVFCILGSVVLNIFLTIKLSARLKFESISDNIGNNSEQGDQVLAAPLSPESIAIGLDPKRPGEPSVGSLIPSAELVGRTGETSDLSGIGNGLPTLLIFLSVECSSCQQVGLSVVEWASKLNPVQIRVATSSSPDSLDQTFPGIAKFGLYGSKAAKAALGIQYTPAAVVLGGMQQPIVASPVAYGVREIEGLVNSLSLSMN